MNHATFQRIRDLVYDESGIHIQAGKEAMVSARLARRIRELGLADDVEYLELLERDLRTEVVTLIDLISTNVTHFFREPEHFDIAAEAVAKWAAEGQQRFRLWCAATATGEEPYSIAMVMRQVTAASRKPLDLRILASDISTRALAHAEAGRYGPDRVEKVPTDLRAAYLKRVSEPDGWAVKDELRRMILFRRINLSDPPFPMRGPLDVVFCRNVMFYFDDVVKEGLVGAIHDLLRPGGILFVGKSESVPQVKGLFERMGPSAYRKTTGEVGA